MPEKRTIAKARKDKREGKAATTQAGEFVREEIRKIRRGEHRGTLAATGHCHRPFRGEARGR